MILISYAIFGRCLVLCYQIPKTCQYRRLQNTKLRYSERLCVLQDIVLTQCKSSWNSCQDLACFYIVLFTLETLDKKLFILASHKPLEILDRTLAKSLIKSVKKINALPATQSFYEVLYKGQHKVLNSERDSLVGSAESCGIIGTLIKLQLASVFVRFFSFTFISSSPEFLGTILQDLTNSWISW